MTPNTKSSSTTATMPSDRMNRFADFADLGERSRLVVTVQISSRAEDMEAGYQLGFGAGLG